MTSAITLIQKTLGVPATGKWDPITLGALAAFQASHKTLMPTGHPDVPTLALLGYYDPVAQLRPEWAGYVKGERGKPSTFGRDLGAASNQVPQWAWLATGALLLGVGLWTWKKSSKPSEHKE
jgi:hypothetical protein